MFKLVNVTFNLLAGWFDQNQKINLYFAANMKIMKLQWLFVFIPLALASCNNSKTGNLLGGGAPFDSTQLDKMPLPDESKFVQVVKDVDSFWDFYHNIGSHRTLQIRVEFLFPMEVDTPKNPFVEYNVGGQMVIKGVSDLKIIGVGNKPVKITQPNSKRELLSFVDCNNIEIENVEADGGDVIYSFANCHNVFINKSIIHGAEKDGILAEGCTNMNFKKVQITDCQGMTFELNKSSKMRFFDCNFNNNNQFDFIGSNYVIFNKTTISDYKAFHTEPLDTALFNMNTTDSVFVKGCTIKDNFASKLTTSPANLILINNISEGNNWDKK